MKLLVANWKMNPATFGAAEKLARATAEASRGASCEVVVCPPFVWLTDLSHKKNQKIKWGAQDVFWKETGAFTGEISPLMLKSSGVGYAIIGHSERRALGETDEMINLKIKASLRAGLKIILCVGESLAVRRKGLAAAKRFVLNQMRTDLRGIQNLKPKTSNLFIAYEPIWAISTSGTGLVDTPEKAGAMAKSIKKSWRGMKVLYGGSVTSKNAAGFVKYPGLDGALVGGASLRAEEFKKIIKTAAGTKVPK